MAHGSAHVGHLHLGHIHIQKMRYHQGSRAVFHRLGREGVAVKPRAGNAEIQAFVQFLPAVQAQGRDLAIAPDLQYLLLCRTGQNR